MASEYAAGAGGRRLFVGGIPRHRHKEEVWEELSKLMDGIVDVILYPSAADKTKNRGFAFVEFSSPTVAAATRARLYNRRGELWGRPICVDWAAPEPQVAEELMATVKVLYVRNLMLYTPEEAIRDHFDTLIPGSVERVKKLKDFAFVHYVTRRAALYNLERLNGSILEGAVLEVQLAKPTDKAGQLRRGIAPGSPSPFPAFSSLNPISLPFLAANDYTQPRLKHQEQPHRQPPHPPQFTAQKHYRPSGIDHHDQQKGAIESLAEQEARVALLSRQQALEAEKLALMHKEARFKRDLAAASASAGRHFHPPQPQPLLAPPYPFSPNTLSFNSFLSPLGQTVTPVPAAVPAPLFPAFRQRPPPPPTTKKESAFGPSVASLSPVSLHSPRLEGGGKEENIGTGGNGGTHSQGSSPGLSSISAGTGPSSATGGGSHQLELLGSLGEEMGIGALDLDEARATEEELPPSLPDPSSRLFLRGGNWAVSSPMPRSGSATETGQGCRKASTSHSLAPGTPLSAQPIDSGLDLDFSNLLRAHSHLY